MVVAQKKGHFSNLVGNVLDSVFFVLSYANQVKTRDDSRELLESV